MFAETHRKIQLKAVRDHLNSSLRVMENLSEMLLAMIEVLVRHSGNAQTFSFTAFKGSSQLVRFLVEICDGGQNLLHSLLNVYEPLKFLSNSL